MADATENTEDPGRSAAIQAAAAGHGDRNRPPAKEESVESTRGKLRAVWAIAECAGRTTKTRIGVAWEGADGSILARLDALPVSGQLTIEGWQPALETATNPVKEAWDERRRA